MKTDQIQKMLCKQEILKGNIPCENISAQFLGEADVLSILKSGYITEFEVKISRSDFKADAKKHKWKHYELRIKNSIPNYFYYVCPENLIDKSEIQSYAGLIYVSMEGLKIIKKAKILHRHKHDLLRIFRKFCRVKSERKYLGCCLLTYNNNQIKERNKKINGLT